MNRFNTILLAFILFTSCNQNTEVKKFFKHVEAKSSVSEINDYKKISEDSIFYVYSYELPHYINDNYRSYPNKTKLESELNSNFEFNSKIIGREILMMLFHLKLNGKKLSKNNLENHWKYYLKTNKEQEKKDSIKLNQFIVKNFKNHNNGDLIEVKFDVEKSEYDQSRQMTYPSVYRKINPKAKFEDSLVIQGKLLRKGNYPDFSDKVEFTNQTNPLMFEIEMTEINDTNIDITYKGPTDDLRVGELFYIDLEGYGCREIIKVNE